MKQDCGSCSACCFLMSVPDINKPAAIWCQHAVRPHGGCAVYGTDAKPQACSDFACLWLVSQDRAREDRMPLDMRPDRSHVMFHDARDDKNVLYAHVFPTAPDAWHRPDVKAHIDMVLERGCGVEVIIGRRRIVLAEDRVTSFPEDGSAARTALRQLP